MNVSPSWATARNRPGSSRRRRTRRAPRAALLDELVDAAAADRHERDLGGDEERLQDGEEDEEQDLAEREAHVPAAPSARGCARGSRIRAGTPTASLPGGHVLRDDGARAGPRALADLDRRDEHRVDAQERVRPDRGSGSSCVPSQLAVIVPAPTFVPSPISASPR